MLKKPKICTFASDDSGVAFFRIHQPLKELAKRGWNIVKLPVGQALVDNIERVTAEMISSDIIFLSAPNENFYDILSQWKGIDTLGLMENAKIKKQHIVIDYDDDMFNVSPFNIPYAIVGTKEYIHTMPDGTQYKPYEDGRIYNAKGDKFDIEANKIRMEKLHKIMLLADKLTTTTQYMKNSLHKHTVGKDIFNDIFVLPNSIDYSLLCMVTVPHEDIRIVWSLSASHFGDWTELRKPLGDLLKKYPNVTFYPIGQKFGLGRDIPLSQVKHIGWTEGVSNYYKVLAGIDADIGICFLQENEFNANKSPLKWEENGALGIPSVVSKCVYANHVTDGENALIGINAQDFCDKLEILIQDEVLRKKISINVDNTIKSKYDIKVIADKYENMFNKIVAEV